MDKSYINMLYEERRELIARRKELLWQIETLTPPPGCRWCNKGEEMKFFALKMSLSSAIKMLDQNKMSIQAAHL